MAENPLNSPELPLLDRMALEEQFGNYTPTRIPDSLPNIPFRGLSTPGVGGGDAPVSALEALDASVRAANKGQQGGSIPRSMSELTNPRFNAFVPGDYNNEDAYAQGQGWTEKMVNSVGKGIALTGTTFLQGTVGLVNGVGNWISTGNFSSFYDNDLNRGLDNLNKELDNNLLPNYYTDVEKNARWYSPDKLFTANFLWNGIVKNLGYAAGAALTGGVYSAGIKALSALPGISRLVSVGKQAEVLAATEAGLASANKVADTFGKVKSLSDRFITSYNALNKGGRAVVAGLSTTGEAAFEALQTLNEKRNQLIDEYTAANNGVYPDAQALEDINVRASEVGNSAFLLNVGLLTATNYIQFPKILGSTYKGEKSLLNGLARETRDIVEDAGKYIAKPSRANKILGTLNKIRPYTFSVSEAFEEGAQFAIGKGVQNYYNKKDNNEPTSFLDSLSEGFIETLTTDEGIENVLIGGLSGAIMQAKGTFAEQRDKSKNTIDAIEKFNKYRLSDFTKETIDSVNRGTVLQQEREEFLKKGDVLNSKDREADFVNNYLSPRIKYGRFDLVQADINDYRFLASTEEGFAQLVAEGKALSTDTAPAFLDRLSKFEQTANNTLSLYESLNLRYGGQVDDEGNLLYTPQVIDKMVYAASKVADYDVRIPAVTSKLTAAGIDVNQVMRDIIDGNVDSFNDAIDNINKITDLTDDQKEDIAESLEDVAEMAIRRDSYLKEYNEIKKEPTKFQEFIPTDIEETEVSKGETIKVKTKNGEKEIEVGTEYFVGKGVDYDKDGLEVPVGVASLTILGENEDGTIKIKDGKGQIRDISKEVLEDYKLGKVADLRANKTANYFYNHKNEIFEYNFGEKAGGKKQGRLEYDKGKLFFVYKDNKGKIKRKALKNEFFVAQEGYTQARIKKVGEIENEEQRIAREEFTSAEEIAIQKETLAKNRDNRLAIITELATEYSERLEKIEKKLAAKKEQLEKINEDLEEYKGLEKKDLSGNTIVRPFNKLLSRALRSISSLNATKEVLEKEIAELTADRDELEFNLSYFEDFKQNLDELPENSGDFLKELKNQVNTIEELRNKTEDNIKSVNKVIQKIEKSITEFTKLLKDSFEKFDKDYPSYIKDEFEKIINENGVLADLPSLKNFIADYVLLADTKKEISLSKDKIAKLSDQINDLYKDFLDIQQEYDTKKLILDKFQAVADAYQARKAEETKMMENEQLLTEALGTAESGVQTVEFNKEYEPTAKKSDEIIPRATMGIVRGKPHQIRANTFGFNLNRFDNRKNIRGVYVTSKNEDQLVPGLTDMLRMDEAGLINEDINKDEIIALVMIQEDENGKIQLVGVDGQPVPDGANSLESAIFQVFPDANLTWGAEFNNESMFRKDTPQEVRDAVTKQYKQWRNSVLENPDLSEYHEIEASFGRVENVTDADGKVIYDTRTSVQDANLITADELESTQLITIPTLPTEGNNVALIEKGIVTFRVPVGTVLLETPNGLVKLQNKQHSEKEAETIYEAILQLAKNMLDPKVGIKDAKSERLLNWLKSTVYWGIPENQNKERKPAGYNSAFFEKDSETGKLMLTLSGKGKDFVFTPTALEENKDAIVLMLSNMYNNINNHFAKQLNEPYEEILSISESGEITSRTWKNYQSYLLSNQTPDGKTRSGEELPLSTTVRPTVNDEDVNRTNIYFFTTDTADNFVIPIVEKKKAVTPKVLTPGAPTPTAAPISTDAKALTEEEADWLYNNLKQITEKYNSSTLADSVDPNLKTLLKFGETTVTAIEPRAGDESYIWFERPTGKWLISIDQRDGKQYLVLSKINDKGTYYAQRISEEELQKLIDSSGLRSLIDSIYQDTNVGQPKTRRDQFEVQNALQQKYGLKRTYKDIIKELAALEGAKPVTYKLDGTPETYISQEGRKIIFIASRNTTADNINEEIKILKGGDLDEVVAKIKDAGKDPGEILKKTIFNAIAPTLNEMKSTEDEISVPGDVDEITVSVDDDVDEVTVPGDVEEVVVADAESKMGKPISQSVLDAVNRKISGLDNEALRVVIEKELKAFVPENWDQVEAWLKDKLPNVPVYRVKNIIQATNGRQAWGMFKDGAIYIYENAEVGTVYHEVFHAVWRMFSDPTEQKAVLDEMRSRGGKFYDRASMKDLSYSEATEEQLEEKLAEEFRDYVQFKKIPAKPSKGRPYILKLFADMVTAIKEFFLGPNADSKVEQMFSKIGQGYYKSHVPFQNNLSFAKEGVIDIEDAFADSDAVLSVAGINDKERSDIIQHMTYLTLVDLIKTDESLFNIEKRNKKQVYAKLKDQVLETISQKIRGAQSLVSDGEFTQEEVNPLISNTLQLMQNVEDQWSTITERHEEYLKSYAIEFDENDNINLRDENNSGRETYQDATKIDNFKKSNSAVKILLATVPEVDDAGKLVPSSIGGAKLLPVSKTYISMMNNLHTSASVEDMLGRLRQMAVSDPNYRTLYRRITKRDWKDGGVDLSKVDTQHGLQLISSIWNTFKKQNPDVRNVFILENGEVVVGEANLSSAAQQLRSEYINSIVFKAKEGKGFFKYDSIEKVFKGDPTKVKDVNLNSVKAMVDFLNKMGIPFTVSDVNKMTPEQYKVFKAAVTGIKESISKTEKIATFSGKALGMSGRLLELGLVKSAVSNPEFSSTYFNVSGERTQSFIGTNAASDLYEFLSKLERFNKESVGGTRYGYLLTDSFAKGSNLLSRMFTDAGTRKKDTEDLFKIGYVSGIVNEEKGKRKESSKLAYKDRLIQELNLNLSGYYLNLVPGDASIEWTIKMGNAISTASISRGMGDINAIFKEYFKAELELVRENRSVAKGRKSDEMRFFKGILGEELHRDVLKAKGTPEEVYKAFENKINGKLADFIQKDMIKLKQSLTQYGILKEGMSGFDFENINLPKNIGEKEVDKQLMALTANYMIANIEMHKLLYSDPYQYEDELKRIKSFNSPRQAIINSSPKMNSALSNVWNKGFKAGDIGFTKFTQDYFRSATHADVIGIIDLPNYTSFKETDGSGIINMKANRQFRIRAGNWNSEEERQYRYDIAWEKRDKDLPLLKEEVAILAAGNPGIQSAYTPLKPIVSGSKLAKNGTASSYNNVVLDKFALYPLSYRIMKEIDKDANAIKLYNKMQEEDIDYVVFASSRKVGAESPHETYKDGAFNNDPYKGVINVPFSIMSIQSEVPSKEDNLVTRGSQITKLITLDFMEAGVPIDFMEDTKDFTKRYQAWYKLSDVEKVENSELYKEIKNNQDLLEALIEEGYKTTLERLGIKETITKDKDGKIVNRKFEITDFSKSAKTLRDEMLKREVNDNISDALAGFLQGKVVLEATPAYQQVRNIIYSIADKQFISPKISGGMKVQIPSTMLESGIRNVKDGLYESDVLKFYEKDGKRIAEVMLGRWFDSPLSDEELLEYLNTTDEGQKILAGVGYRIPSQKQNSFDAIVIKKFLPKEFRDSVVIPAALVQKVGSDFDIDKLSVYLKNLFVKDGKPKLIPYFGIGEQAINKFRELFDKGEFLTDEEMKELDRYIAEEQLLLQDIAEESASGKLMSSIFGKLFSEEELTQEFTRGIPSKDQIISRLYKKSLENEYIQSMENLITHPKNYDNLIKPNSAESLKKLSEEIAEKTVGQSFDYKNVDNMLDRTFMSRLRHAFVTGKYAIGIAAVNQTNHSLNQRQPIYIDKSRLSRLSEEDRFWLGNANIRFDKYNAIEIDGKMVPTLSMVKNKAGEYISDIIGMFIDGYVDISKGPWIMELGATPNVASTWLFLVKAGVPVKTVAYFMNQPIIRDYLRSIESAGYSWLFMDTFVNLTAESYGIDVKEADLLMDSFRIPGETALKNNVGKSPSTMTSNGRMEQYLMLREFLKYAKMGEQMFHVTQGSNYDTSTFNDPYLVFKKQMQQIKAQNTIISSVDTLLANSFIGKLAEMVNSVRDAFAQIIKSDSPKVRNVIQKVLLPYVETSDRDFVKIAQKAVADLFDWAVQTDQKLNEMVKDILVNDGGVGKEVAMFVNEVKSKGREHALFGNHIIDIIEGIPSIRAAAGGPNNAKLNMGENKVYDQNNVIYAFRELRDYLKGENNPLYERIKLLAVLQSGLSTSPISFTNLLPYEDFENIYNKTLSKLEGMPNLEDFYKLGVFQRNNWNNDDVVPYLKAALITTEAGRTHYNPSMKFLPDAVKKAMASNDIPPILTRSKMNREANSDYIVYTWEKQEEILTKEELEEAIADRNVYKAISNKKAEMRRAADYSYINKALFKKVYDNYNTALEHTAYDGKKYFVYKAINAWGDSFRANEFWATDHKSVLENGFMKVEDVDNNVIISKFLNGSKVKTKPTTSGMIAADVKTEYPGKPEFNKLPGKSVTPTMTYAGIGSRQTPPEVLNQMTQVAKELASKGYTLNTGVTFRGGEEGADAAFSKGTTKKNLFSPEKQGSRPKEQNIARELHPNPGALSPGALKLMARNTNQIFGDNLDTPVDFVLFYAKETGSVRPQGGTGQAVEMARLKDIPTINMMDANWKEQLNKALSNAPTGVKGIAMTSPNIEKIKAGKKTTTTRSQREFENIGIPVGQSTTVNFGGQKFTVTNRGLLTVQEAGGKEAMLKSEGYATVNDLLYQQTKDWMNGKGKLYVYDISPIENKDPFTC